MVGITVVFVGVIGTFAFGLSFGSLTTPQATMSTELNVQTDQIELTHIGGDDLAAENTLLVVTNESDGERIEFGPTRDAGSFEVGDTVSITTTSGEIDGWRLAGGEGRFELRKGTTYTIMIVDTNSDTPIYRTSLTTT